jgi:short-subunit dehydrogenase
LSDSPLNFNLDDRARPSGLEDEMRSKVMITGATGGLGKAFAVECARRGWDLFLTDLEADRLDVLADGLRRTYGIGVVRLACDLTDPGSRSNLFDFIRSGRPRFWALINVAGGDFEGTFRERRPEQLRTILRLNIEGALEMTHAVLGWSDPGTPFRIIMVSSLAAFFPMPVKATYAASKRFLLDFSLALKAEVEGLGATVTVLCPAGLPTTDECIEAIEAQGLMGHLTTQNIGLVAARTLDHALKGHAVYVPGLLNQSLLALSRLVPSTGIARLIGRRWQAAHRVRFGTYSARG